MRSLKEWVAALSGTKIPVLGRTIAEMARLRSQMDSITARDISALILRDPLMALKVLRFSQSRLTKRQSTEVTTVEHALMMHGLSNFFREMNDLVAIEKQLANQPAALDGALRIISRACHAASYARNFAALRHDLDSNEVLTSALLHDLAELLVWCAAPGQALQIEHMVHHNRGLRSAAAQRACLGFAFTDLQLALTDEWKLPQLLRSLMDDQHATRPRAQTVAVSAALARHSAGGWSDAALPSDYAAIGKLVNLPDEGVMRWVNQSALQAARLWRDTGVRPAAAWLPMLPGDWPDHHTTTARATDEVIGRVTGQLAAVTRDNGDHHAVLALMFYALTEGLGLRRMCFSSLNTEQRKLAASQALLLDPGLSPADLTFELGSGHLFERLLSRVQGVWFGAAQRAKLSPLLPTALRAKLVARDFFAMSVHLRGQPFGLIYADGGSSSGALTETQYASFKNVCTAANGALDRIAG